MKKENIKKTIGFHKSTEHIKRLLDLGCHNAHSKKRYEPEEYVGVDMGYFNSQGEKESREDIQVNFNKHFKLPFEEQYFDVVLVQNIIEHLFNVFPIIDEANRLARSKIIIIIPNCLTYDNRILMLFGKNKAYPSGDNWATNGHHVYFDEGTLKSFCDFFFPNFEVTAKAYKCGARFASLFKHMMFIRPQLFASEIEYELKRKASK
jgi:hypothetical protein